MGIGAPTGPDRLAPDLIAPCGMDCGVCIAHLRDRNPCVGCNGEDSSKPHHCTVCRMKHCDELTSHGHSFCFECPRFPCPQLRNLDKRYRSKYRMSMLENLEEVRRIGLEQFVESERIRWACDHCGALVSVHRKVCLACGESAESSRGAGLTGVSS